MIKLPKISMLSPELTKLLKMSDSVKIIGTLDASGEPRLSANDTLTSLNGISLILSEKLEKSQCNRDLVRSIWYGKPVTVLVFHDGTSFEIRAKIYRCLIVGPIFDEMLARAREKYGPDADIAAVWELIPEKCRDVSEDTILREQKAAHPYYDSHLDRESIRSIISK